jgi:hypothetical protein
MPERDKDALPAVSSAPLAQGYDRRRSTPQPATSGRCGFCGSHDTFSISAQTFQEWALERWGDAALLRCHDCGKRQAIAGLGAPLSGEWRLGRGIVKVAAWGLGLFGAVALLLMLLRRAEQGPEQGPLKVPPRERPSPSAPAPSPPSGPFSLRSSPSSAA